MENGTEELNELSRLLAQLEAPKLDPDRAERLRGLSVRRLSSGRRWEWLAAHDPGFLLPRLAGTGVICAVAGSFLAWAVVRTANLLGLV
jgi:hypothetical protein